MTLAPKAATEFDKLLRQYTINCPYVAGPETQALIALFKYVDRQQRGFDRRLTEIENTLRKEART